LGIFVSIYALHSRRLGAGDLRDFEQISSWVRRWEKLGTAGETAFWIGLRGGPYLPARPAVWNEFYLMMPAIQEFACHRKRKDCLIFKLSFEAG